MGNKQSTKQDAGTGVKNATPRKPTVVRNKIDYHLHVHTETQFDEETFNKEVPDFHGMVTIEAPRYETENRASVDIIAVLDKSGSMAGEKISLVRKAMRRLVRNLGAKDRVAFIQFDTTVSTLMPFTQMDDIGRSHAKQLIANLTQGSSTNLCGGLTNAIEMLQNNISAASDVQAILLFTDGQANAGPATDMHGILKHVREAAGMKEDPIKWNVEQVISWLKKNNLAVYAQNFRENGVDGQMLLNDVNADNLDDLKIKSLHKSKMLRLIDGLRPVQVEGEGQTTAKQQALSGMVLHTFGFGCNHNVELLESLANEFDGMYFFMENEAAIIGGFANVLGGLLSVAAKEIELILRPEGGCSAFEVLKDEDKTVNKDGSVTVRFADLQSEESRHIVLKCNLPKLKEPNENFQFLSGELKYKNIVRDQDEQATFNCVVKRTGNRGKRDMQIDVEKNRVLSARALKEAESKGDSNDLSGARLVVNDAIASILKSPSANQDWCKSAVSDLRNCIDGLQSHNAYASKGKQYMVQNKNCYQMERNCNYQVDEYESQAAWDTNCKSAMYEEFRRADSCDSVECVEDRFAFDQNQAQQAPMNFMNRERSLSLSSDDSNEVLHNRGMDSPLPVQNASPLQFQISLESIDNQHASDPTIPLQQAPQQQQMPLTNTRQLKS